MNLLIYRLLALITVSVVIGFLCGRSDDTRRRYAAALAYVGGFVCGYALLEPHSWRPTTYWHWLPWLGGVAALVGPVGLASGVHFVERWALIAVMSLAAAWLLVPTWADLRPSRGALGLAFAGIVFFVTLLLGRLVPRVSGGLLCASVGLSSLCGTALIAAFVSLRFGLLTAAATAAWAGASVAVLRDRTKTSLRGLLPVHAVIFGGLLLAAQVNVALPRLCFVLIAAAPLMLWPFELRPLAKLRGKSAILVRLAAVSVPLTIACGLAYQAMRSG